MVENKWVFTGLKTHPNMNGVITYNPTSWWTKPVDIPWTPGWLIRILISWLITIPIYLRSISSLKKTQTTGGPWTLLSWWFFTNPFEKYARHNGNLSPSRGINKTYLEPPPSYYRGLLLLVSGSVLRKSGWSWQGVNWKGNLATKISRQKNRTCLRIYSAYEH